MIRFSFINSFFFLFIPDDDDALGREREREGKRYVLCYYVCFPMLIHFRLTEGISVCYQFALFLFACFGFLFVKAVFPHIIYGGAKTDVSIRFLIIPIAGIIYNFFFCFLLFHRKPYSLVWCFIDDTSDIDFLFSSIFSFSNLAIDFWIVLSFQQIEYVK